MEIWKDIESYIGLYQVSNLGQIKSLRSNKILKPSSSSTGGYLYVCLYKDGKGKCFSIHRLVAIAFIPNEQNFSQVDHIDNNKKNNRVENLQWLSQTENLRKQENGIAIPRRVICIETGEIFESVHAAATAINRSKITMSQHLRGLTKTCAGKHFKYYDGE